MKTRKYQRNSERLNDLIAYRITSSQRAFLEKVAEEKNIGLGAAARLVIDEVRMKAGAAV